MERRVSREGSLSSSPGACPNLKTIFWHFLILLSNPVALAAVRDKIGKAIKDKFRDSRVFLVDANIAKFMGLRVANFHMTVIRQSRDGRGSIFWGTWVPFIWMKARTPIAMPLFMINLPTARGSSR